MASEASADTAAAESTITTATTTDPIAKALEDLEVEKTLITTCTKLWRDLFDHFSSLAQTLADRSKTFESNIQTLDSETQHSLESLSARESSIPNREAAAAALIEERRASAIAETEDPEFKPPEDVRGFVRLYCRRMDSAALWRFIASRRKDLANSPKEVADAVVESVDPARLVLDAVADFVATAKGSDGCWALGMLIGTLFDEDGRKTQEVSESIRERAAAVVEELKVKLEGEGEGAKTDGPKAHVFLQLVVAFGLKGRFEEEFLRKLVLEHASRKDMAKLAAELGFGEKIADIIDELVKAGKDIEAVYFAHESGMIERFSPVTLIKNYLHRSRKRATSIWKNGKQSVAATEESSSVELTAIKSIIKCVETLNLEQKYSLESLRTRLSQLEKSKADRKKTATVNRSNFKRSRSGGSNFRQSKAVKASSTAYPSYRRNPAASNQISSAHHSYNYQGKAGFDGPASSSFGAALGRSPSAITPQYYLPEDMAGPRGGMPYGGPSVGYGGFDYTAQHTAPNQPMYPHQH